VETFQSIMNGFFVLLALAALVIGWLLLRKRNESQE